LFSVAAAGLAHLLCNAGICADSGFLQNWHHIAVCLPFLRLHLIMKFAKSLAKCITGQLPIRRLASALASLGLLLSGPAAYADQLANAGYKPLMWKISTSGKPVYLFGSIHVAKPDFYPLPAPVEKAYQQAGTLVVEVDASAPDANSRMLPFVTYASPDNLQKHLTVPVWQKVVGLLGPAAEQVKAMKPAMVSTALAMSAFSTQGYVPQAGIDLHFISQAKADKKQVLELESLEFQAQVLGGLNDADGESMLNQIVDGFQNGEAIEMVNTIVTAWKAGDSKGLVDAFTKEAEQDPGSAHLTQLLIDGRNPHMADGIAKLAKEGKGAFVVVGVGHLVGPNSVVELLKKRGMQVQQVE
jgi:uncharacterized protein YbaP (TraB family)